MDIQDRKEVRQLRITNFINAVTFGVLGVGLLKIGMLVDISSSWVFMRYVGLIGFVVLGMVATCFLMLACLPREKILQQIERERYRAHGGH